MIAKNTLPEQLTISNNRLLIRVPTEQFISKSNSPKLNIHKFEDYEINALTGNVNKNLHTRMRKVVQNFVNAINENNRGKGGILRHLITFATLTLPAKQMHSDKELNRLALSRLLQVLKRKLHVEHFVWKLELQENGNIHYHILIDRYINWKALRYHWNIIMNDLGYIEAYRANRLAYHSNGFQLDKSLLNKFPKKEQLRQYNEGMACNWSNPNSTDIHRLKDVKDVSAYVLKYITKEIEGRKVECRIWGSTKKLKELKEFSTFIGLEEVSFINEMHSKTSSGIFECEYNLCIYSKSVIRYLFKHKNLFERYRQHHLRNYHYLYEKNTYNE